MIVTYLRSSSSGCFDICEQKYYLTYVLGKKEKTGLKATKGSIMHKTLEVLALRQFAKQNNKRKVETDYGKLKLSECDDIEFITRQAFEQYKQLEQPTLTEEDYDDCLKWIYKAIAYRNGDFDPRNKDIFGVEYFFDFEIKKPWAKYSYQTPNGLLEGHLAIKGTIDLLVDKGNNCIEMRDYKSGKRLNWSTGEIKTSECLEKDPQLLLYYYALKQIFPDKDFYITIYYVNDGGAFTFPYDEQNYLQAEKLIQKKFEQIKKTRYPKLISNSNTHWKCKYLCSFSKPIDINGTTECQFFRDEIRKKGIDKVTKTHADFSKISSYSGGGGRTEEQVKQLKK